MCLFGVNFVVLLVWNVSDPVQWIREPVDDPDTAFNLVEVSTFGSCDSVHYRVYLGIIIGVNLIVSLISLVQAYECRKISTEYSQSFWISSALVCIVQVWLVGLPALKLLSDNPPATFFVKFGIVFITCMSSLLLLFVPKMRYLRESLEERKHGVPRKRTRYSSSARSGDPTMDNRSQLSEDSNGNKKGHHSSSLVMKMGNTRVSGLEPPSTNATGGGGGGNGGNATPSKPAIKNNVRTSGMEGIRIIQSSIVHSEEVARLQKNY